jgi:hypothetical protein
MRSLWADQAGIPLSRRIHPILSRAADEVCGTLAQVIAYVMALALLGILGLSFWDQVPRLEPSEPIKAGWMVAGRSHPAYAVSRLDVDEKSEAYEIVRHPEGGRRDIFRWASPGDKPAAELEIYRLGAEAASAAEARADLAARMPSAEASDLEMAGVIDSKFGTFALFRRAGTKEGVRQGVKDGSCLGFLKRIDDPALQISGWSCQGTSVPLRRAAIGCLLNRLTLLVSGNDPKLAEFFARAELRRGSCNNAAPSSESADWVIRADGPRLRGAL